MSFLLIPLLSFPSSKTTVVGALQLLRNKISGNKIIVEIFLIIMDSIYYKIIFGKMRKKVTHNYCLMNKILGALFLGLLYCNTAQTGSSLPGCQGSNFPTWTDCYGKVGPLPISGDIYAGEWKVGKYHGQGTIEYSDGTKYVGKWKDGLPNGKGTLTDSSDNKYVGEFKDGMRHGIGNHLSANGGKYLGEWKNDEYHGQGTNISADGKKYVGKWKDGLPN